jgi:hypothetical protein
MVLIPTTHGLQVTKYGHLVLGKQVTVLRYKTSTQFWNLIPGGQSLSNVLLFFYHLIHQLTSVKTAPRVNHFYF